MDEFLIRYTFHSLQKRLDESNAGVAARLDGHDADIASLTARVTNLESQDLQNDGEINTLRQQVTDMQKMIASLSAELTRTKLVNLKQDIVMRTLHNLNAFDAHDMFVDTFSSPDKVDFTRSIRLEWMSDLQAIGKTRTSVLELQQIDTNGNLLIAKTPTTDDAVAQSFLIDKRKPLDKVSVKVERFNDDTFQPLIVSLRETIDGPDLTSADIGPDQAVGDFVDVDLPDYVLEPSKDYYLVLSTQDPYGYKVAMHTNDKYFGGTSFTRFNNVWTDNNHDIAFKIWCFPADDENNATAYTIPKTYPTRPISIVFEVEDTEDNGTINYYVSRDNGVNWKLLQPGIMTDLEDLPVGNTLIIRAYITGQARVEAWGYVITRGDT